MTVGCAAVSSFSKAWVHSGGSRHWFTLRHTFRKANDTITTMLLWNNEIGDAGAVALAESLKARIVTCVLQVRALLMSWPVWARIHRRRSGTCRATVLSWCSIRFFRVDV